MQDIWQLGLADQQGSIYDEAIERKWSETWLFYATAMEGGGDYGVFAGGRYQLSRTLLEMDDWLKLRKKVDATTQK